jgi:epoxyqueuosine reductase
MRTSSDNIEQKIKAEALRLGFSYCGISRAEAVSEKDILFMEGWISEGCQADMSYLERNKEKRYNPQLLFEGTKSIISVALNYYTEDRVLNKIDVAKFAKVRDYHTVMKEKLHELLNFISLLSVHDEPLCGRCFCDSAPVMERYWAWKSGMGWIGRNHCLIIPNLGSYIVLGELFLNIELNADEPITGNCLECNKCLQTCPTEALSYSNEEGTSHFDARKCLSFHTIESKERIPDIYGKKLDGIVFGCDKCQSVCPHNNNVPQSTVFSLLPFFADNNPELLQKMSEEEFNIEFSESTIKRAGYNKLKQSIESQI